MTSLSQFIGGKIFGGARYLSGLLLLGYFAVRAWWTEGVRAGKGRRVVGRILFNQIRFTGYDACPRITFTALSFGAIVVVQSLEFLGAFTTTQNLYETITLIIVKEVSPIIIALILIGRSGTAIATELGNMRLNREVEALGAMGLDLKYYIVWPRLAGFVVSILALIVYFNIAALVGGYVVALALGKAPTTFTLLGLLEAVSVRQLSVSLLKGLCFGAIIATVACRHGLAVQLSFQEVPQVATKTVVNSMVLCFTTNTIISIML